MILEIAQIIGYFYLPFLRLIPFAARNEMVLLLDIPRHPRRNLCFKHRSWRWEERNQVSYHDHAHVSRRRCAVLFFSFPCWSGLTGCIMRNWVLNKIIPSLMKPNTVSEKHFLQQFFLVFVLVFYKLKGICSLCQTSVLFRSQCIFSLFSSIWKVGLKFTVICLDLKHIVTFNSITNLASQ